MKTIPLTRGKVAIVDGCNYERLAKHKWYAYKDRHQWYARRRNPAKRNSVILMHQEVLPVPRFMEIDHINGDGLDNRLENLRAATRSQNAMNRHRAASATGVKGVTAAHGGKRTPRKYRARIGVGGGRSTTLGYFSSLQEAASAYDEAARKRFGQYARTNQ